MTDAEANVLIARIRELEAENTEMRGILSDALQDSAMYQRGLEKGLATRRLFVWQGLITDGTAAAIADSAEEAAPEVVRTFGLVPGIVLGDSINGKLPRVHSGVKVLWLK